MLFENTCKYCWFHRQNTDESARVKTVLCCLDPATFVKFEDAWCGHFKLGGKNCEMRLIEITAIGERVFTKKQQRDYQKHCKVWSNTTLKVLPKDYLRYNIWYEEE